MNTGGGHVIAEFSDIELMRAESILSQMDPAQFGALDYYGMHVYEKHYGKEFEGSKIKKSHFLKCKFDEVSFLGTVGASSSFKECTLRNCLIKNACFDFSNFSKSHLIGDNSTTYVEASSFSHADFSETDLSGINCSGCSFENSYFKNAIVKDSVWQHCSFEGAYFENTVFENVDLSQTSIDFSVMKNVTFENVKLPFTGILHAFGGLQNVEKQMGKVIFKFPLSDIEVTFAEFIEKIESIQAFFFKRNDFFTLSIINIYFGNHELAYQYLGRGLLYCLKHKDFRMIGYYCKLASLNHFFTNEQLQRLYEKMKSNEFIKTMTSHEYHVYLYELDRIKRILVDNPFGLPQIKISVKTNILPEDVKLTSELLNLLDETVQIYAPQASTFKTIRHNSPLLIEIFSSDSLDTLYNLAILLSAGVFGVTTTISRIHKIISEHHKIIGLKLDNELKKLESKNKRCQLKNQELPEQRYKAVPSFSSYVNESIVSISFSMYTDKEVPEELREVTIKKEGH